MSNSNLGMKLVLEIVWSLFTVVIVLGVLYPILHQVSGYEYVVPNVIFIVVFITAARHIFFFKNSLIAKNNILKVVMVIACIPVLAYLIQYLNTFQHFLDNMDNKEWNVFFGDIGYEKQMEMYKYIRSEMIFFGTAAIISAIILPVRLLLSVWRQKNRGTV